MQVSLRLVSHADWAGQVQTDVHGGREGGWRLQAELLLLPPEDRLSQTSAPEAGLDIRRR